MAVTAPFLMVLGIIWIVSRSKLEKQKIEATADATSEKAAQYVGQVKDLEDRVQVLERIITDRGYDVATQIEALRDTKRVEDEGMGVPLDMTNKERA
ncbi:hypothetical protein [Erythrobacter litoralis]|uniref:Uncharacterized protein n=1 Tax=Erythrobacter litoralis (strain HTCC2594) TaxID=314225 RepID=Q2NC24_ERYLH|nr:hypothetical protein ELI_03375 [Erythrobacter litoralis HTCC2594]